MYLPIPSQPDCPTAWLSAVKAVDSQPQHTGYNVIIDIENPVVNCTRTSPIVKAMDDFLVQREKSVMCVANTIFPEVLYRMHGAKGLFETFEKNILPKVKKGQRWSGYYFERMMLHPGEDGKTINQLSNIVERIRDETNPSLNKFELSIFDPVRDVDDSPYGGQCLSFLSFKIVPGTKRKLALTALYRNHYYIEKLLGNLIGLGRLMNFVAKEGGLDVGALTVISTHAVIDQPKASRTDITSLVSSCTHANASSSNMSLAPTSFLAEMVAATP